MIPKFFDAHGHPNFAVYDKDRESVIKNALDQDIWINIVGTQKDTSKKAVEIAEKYENGVFATIGLHPIHTNKSFHDEEELGSSFAQATEGKEGFTSRGEEFDYDYYKKLAMSSKVVAIGECGLDYFRSNSDNIDFSKTIEKQEEIFIKQIELANEIKKPLMLHLRNSSSINAYEEAYRILKNRTKVKIDFHFFAGNTEDAKKLLDLGAFFSFTGVITFARNYDEVVKYIPIDRIMSETDCPYITPAPWRGKRNEPCFVVKTAEKIAEIRGTDKQELSQQIVKNAISFFGLGN